MSILTTIFDVLSEDHDLTELVGTRIYPGRAPARVTLPFVKYFRVSNPHIETQEGATMAYPRVQFTVWATTALEAETVALALKRAVRTIPDAAIIVGGGDTTDPATDAYGVHLDAEVYTREV
jgi:hypothetical protein